MSPGFVSPGMDESAYGAQSQSYTQSEYSQNMSALALSPAFNNAASGMAGSGVSSYARNSSSSEGGEGSLFHDSLQVSLSIDVA